jgi:hypothetical protein
MYPKGSVCFQEAIFKKIWPPSIIKVQRTRKNKSSWILEGVILHFSIQLAFGRMASIDISFLWEEIHVEPAT